MSSFDTGGDGVSEQTGTFEAMQSELARKHPGRFAVMCASRLIGVYASVDAALLACSMAFDTGALPEGAPVLINELAVPAPLRVTARPYERAPRRRAA